MPKLLVFLFFRILKKSRSDDTVDKVFVHDFSDWRVCLLNTKSKSPYGIEAHVEINDFYFSHLRHLLNKDLP